MAEQVDPRRRVPRTDALLADDRIRYAVQRHGALRVRAAVTDALAAVRAGQIPAEGAVDAVLAVLPAHPSSLTPVLNATGVVVHTNLGRAPLSEAAREAIVEASGPTDVELDLTTGTRGRRGAGAIAALLQRVPLAEDALVVNNGAAALLLATTALAAGREVVVSRGELVEIGDGFRLPALVEAGGVTIREVGTTNRTHLADYAGACSDRTGAILKVHPSNFTMTGFTTAVAVADLAALGPPVVHDIGSGLLEPHPLLPREPDAATSLRDGAAVVTCSGDKLLGGPQAGIVLGRSDIVQRLRRHPLARALRVDKTTLAALEATLLGPEPPVLTQLAADPGGLRARCHRLAAALPAALAATVVPSQGRVGGGGAPEIPLDGWAVAVAPALAAALRQGSPPVLARVERDRCLVDLRCVPPADDDVLLAAITAAAGARLDHPGG